MRYCLFIIYIVLVFGIGSTFGLENRIYTSNKHFEEGVLMDVEYDSVGDQLQLAGNGSTIFPIIWIANTYEGTVSKLDTETGEELGRYFVGPPDYTVAQYARYRIIEKRSKRVTKRIGGKPELKLYFLPTPNVPLPNPKVGMPIKMRKRRNKQPNNARLREFYEKYYETVRPWPTATAMDLDGNVWVANLGYGTVVKILNEGGIDSNYNGRSWTIRHSFM